MTSNSRHDLPPRLMAHQPTRFTAAQESKPSPSPGIRIILQFVMLITLKLSVTRDMSGFGSTRSVRFSPEGSHAAGGQNGPDHGCDWVASSEEAELRGGSGTIGHERAALSPAARRL